MSVYPLLLILVTILSALGDKVLGMGIVHLLHRFPVVGAQFSTNDSRKLSGNILGLMVGIIALIYGSLGVAKVLQKSFYHIWNIPRMKKRPLMQRLGRNVLTLCILGSVFLLNALASSFSVADTKHILLTVMILIGILIINICGYYIIFLIESPDKKLTGNYWPGAIVAGTLFTAMTTVGAGLVEHELTHSSETYGAFAQVIGVVTFLLIVSKVTIYSSELNSVVGNKLFPRSIGKANPTYADRKTYELLIQEQKAIANQEIRITYNEKLHR